VTQRANELLQEEFNESFAAVELCLSDMPIPYNESRFEVLLEAPAPVEESILDPETSPGCRLSFRDTEGDCPMIFTRAACDDRGRA